MQTKVYRCVRQVHGGGGVALNDRKNYHVSAERPTKRYWKKIFFNLLDMALLNSYELYKSNTDQREKKTRHDFLASVVESLCAVETTLEAAVRISGNHVLEHLPGKKDRNCVVRTDRAKGK